MMKKNSNSYNAYGDKITLIQNWIDEIDKHNISKKVELIGITMQNEISNFYNGFSEYGDSQPIQYDDDVDLLKAKLLNYLADIKIEAEKLNVEKMKQQVNFAPTITQTQNQTLSVNVTIHNVFKAIETSALLGEEKEDLKDKISGIDAAINTKADKQKVWDKIKGVLGWISNKAVDMGLAVTLIPYLSEILKGLGA